MASNLIAAAYVRFSSDGQREESIEAQLRAIKSFAENHGYILHKVYADRGISGTTDNRAQFQRMINDAKSKKFNFIIVHKLDRFARNRTDSAIYRNELSKNGIKLISVLENFDDSPESIILQSVIEGYNEFYSANLRREVLKGLKENALTCRFTGGIPCLGYDINKDTLKYEINSFEAEAVKLIFKLYLNGEGYTAIINELNRRGFKTKKGNNFGKNSLYEILRNEKYTGTYIYNKSVHPDENGKFNRHAKKSDADIIRIEGGIPKIISKEDFDLVQKKMNERKKRAASFKAKQEYLLSGKLICGECKSTYAGNSRRANGKNPLYISYNCTKRNGTTKCHNPGIQRDILEKMILEHLSEKIFNKKILPEILNKYNDFALNKNYELSFIKTQIETKLNETQKQISNIVDIVASSGSAALMDKLKELENEKCSLEASLEETRIKISEISINEEQIKAAFQKAKKLLRSGTLKNRKDIVQTYINSVTVYIEYVVVEYNIFSSYTITEEIQRKDFIKN